MVKLRLKRFGRLKRPYYRLAAMDSRQPAGGLPIEELGQYDPLEKDAVKAVVLKTERIQYWLSKGAQPSDTVRTLLTKAGIVVKDSYETQKRKRADAKAAKKA